MSVVTFWTYIKWLSSCFSNTLVQFAGNIASPLDKGSSTQNMLKDTECICFLTSNSSSFYYNSSMDKAITILFSDFS